MVPRWTHCTKQAKCTFDCLVRMVFTQRQRMKDLVLRAHVVVRTYNRKISRRHLADCVKILPQKACRTCSTIIFLIQPIKSIICGVDVAVVAFAPQRLFRVQLKSIVKVFPCETTTNLKGWRLNNWPQQNTTQIGDFHWTSERQWIVSEILSPSFECFSLTLRPLCSA